MARRRNREGGVKVLLIGAGGHARNVCEILAMTGRSVYGYVALHASAWLQESHFVDDEAADSAPAEVGVALGIGGTTSDQLRNRLALLDRHARREAPALVHPRAVVSASAEIADGAQIMAGAILQAACAIGRGAIVNTGGIVEHDSRIGAGAHVAPGAIVLGGVTVGDFAMIGSGAILLPGAKVPAGMLVAAGTRFPESFS
jgi:sugar O-acyltransferase (sialic acid O-acetyltransferase NeuD family)